MYQTIAIIGCGSLGGFLANFLAHDENVKKLIIVDNDIVEEKNIKNSIYTTDCVGKPKVVCLKDIINKFSSIEILYMNEMYVEDRTILPKYDLLIDCRDHTYSRKGKINLRLYLSSRFLVFDCRKYVDNEKELEGRYTEYLNKTDLMNASLSAATLICNGTIDQFMRNNLVYNLELDYLTKYSMNYVNTFEKKPDVIYDFEQGEEKFIGLHDNMNDIIEKNRTSDMFLSFSVGSKSLATIPVDKNKLISKENIFKFLSDSIDNPVLNFNYYIVKVENNMIVLIPETGAA